MSLNWAKKLKPKKALHWGNSKFNVIFSTFTFTTLKPDDAWNGSKTWMYVLNRSSFVYTLRYWWQSYVTRCPSNVCYSTALLLTNLEGKSEKNDIKLGGREKDQNNAVDKSAPQQSPVSVRRTGVRQEAFPHSQTACTLPSHSDAGSTGLSHRTGGLFQEASPQKTEDSHWWAWAHHWGQQSLHSSRHAEALGMVTAVPAIAGPAAGQWFRRTGMNWNVFKGKPESSSEIVCRVQRKCLAPGLIHRVEQGQAHGHLISLRLSLHWQPECSDPWS